MGRSRDIAEFLSKTELNNPTNTSLLKSTDTTGIDSAAVQGIGLTSFSTLDSLPVTNLVVGQQAYVTGTNRLYISNGFGWYNTTLVNRSPTWDSEPLSTYEIVDSATPLIITAKALDSDTSLNYLVDQSSATDSAQYMVNITSDSSVFTFTPKSADSIGIEVAAGNLTDSNGDFEYTFKWSDGINFVSKVSTISYSPAGFSGPATYIGKTSGNWTGSSPSGSITWPTGSQAGDMAFIAVGFSGYQVPTAPNETSLNGTSGWSNPVVSNWSSQGAASGSTSYAATIWYKTLTASDLSSTFTLASTESNVYVYGVWDIIVVRGAQGPSIRGTQLNADTGTNGTNIAQASGYIPSSNINTDGFLIDVISTRSGRKTWSSTGNFNLRGQYNNQQIIAQAVYTIPYSDYVSGGYSRMQSAYNQSYSEIYGSHSFVISV